MTLRERGGPHRLVGGRCRAWWRDQDARGPTLKSRVLPGPSTAARSPLRSSRSLGRLKFLEQRRQGPHFLGLPVGHERGKPVHADLAEASHLVGAGRREGHQARPPVSWVRSDLRVPLVLQVPDLPGDERRMNVLEVGDLGGANRVAAGDRLQQAHQRKLPARPRASPFSGTSEI